MSLRVDLERLSERGEPRDPDEVYAAAVEASAASPQSGENLEVGVAGPVRRRRAVWVGAGVAVAAAATLLGGLAANDHPERIDAAAVPETTTTTTLVPPVPIGRLQDMNLVGSSDPDTTGWVTRSRVPTKLITVDGVREPVPVPVPVFGADGRQIAWWGWSLGWIDFDTMNNPDFDYLDEYRTSWEEGQRFRQERDGSPPTSIASPVAPAAGSDLVSVSSQQDSSLVGFVTARDLAADITDYRLAPVMDMSGNQIAWWASGVGWLTLDEVSAGGFDLRQRVVESGVGFGTLPPSANRE